MRVASGCLAERAQALGWSRSAAQITGILDWEMSTIGDPLMDLGTALAYWVEPTDPQTRDHDAVRA
jgi:aminoglycoside phosphotransferase (APT) family kinase protein